MTGDLKVKKESISVRFYSWISNRETYSLCSTKKADNSDQVLSHFFIKQASLIFLEYVLENMHLYLEN